MRTDVAKSQSTLFGLNEEETSAPGRCVRDRGRCLRNRLSGQTGGFAAGGFVPVAAAESGFWTPGLLSCEASC